jgi:hypothetical protein
MPDNNGYQGHAFPVSPSGRKGFFALRLEKGLRETSHIRGICYPCEQCVDAAGILMHNASLDYWCSACAAGTVRRGTPILDFTPLNERAARAYIDLLRQSGYVRGRT